MGEKKKNDLGQSPELFIAGFMIGEKTYILPQPFGAPNQESAAATLTAVVTANYPNIAGFELYRYNTEYENNRQLIMIAPIMQVMTWANPQLAALVGKQVMKAAVPVRPSQVNGENLSELYKAAKENGMKVL